MLLFEREQAFEKYVVMSDTEVLSRLSDKARSAKKPSMTSEYKAVVAAMKTEALEEGKTIVSSDDWQMANDMIDRLATCGLLDTYLAGDYQVGFLEELNGVQVKGFLDCLGDGATASLHVVRRSSAMQCETSATTSKHTSTARSLESRTSIGWCRRRHTRTFQHW